MGLTRPGSRSRCVDSFNGLRRWSCLAIFLVAVLFSSSISAESVVEPPRNLFLEEGKRQIIRARHESAVDELRRALDLPGVPIVQQAEIMFWLGAALYLSSQELEAERVWADRIRLLPAQPVPLSVSSDVRNAFEKVRAQVVSIKPLAPAKAFIGIPLDMEAYLDDPGGRISSLYLYARPSGDAEYSRARFEKAGDRWKVSIVPQGHTSEGYELEYYILALDERGLLLHCVGESDQPLSFWVSPRPEGLFFRASTEREEHIQQKALVSEEEKDEKALTEITSRVLDERYSQEREQQFRVDSSVPPIASKDYKDRGNPRRAWVWGLMLLVTGAMAGGAIAGVFGEDGQADLPTTSLGTIRYPSEGGD